MKIITIMVAGMFLAIAPFAVPIVSAQTTTTAVTTTAKATAQIQVTLRAEIAQLLQQVKVLETKITQMNTAQKTLESSFTALRSQMGIGSKGNGVRLLQKFLASDPTIYPQGLVTGYYGRLTQDAVKKFQENHGISPVGVVGPQTRLLMNAFLKHTNDTLSTNFLRNTEGEQESATSHSPVVTVCRAIANSDRTISKHIPRTSLFRYVKSGYSLGKECGPAITVPGATSQTTAVGQNYFRGALIIVHQNVAGETIHLPKGTRVKIELGSNLSWGLKFTPSGLMTPVANTPTEKGVQGVYEATGVGIATFSAYGSPICLPGNACPANIRLVTIHFDIQSNSPTAAPTCTLSASPTVIHRGQSARLLWGTGYATSLTINGKVVPIAIGHENVSPTNTTTYAGTVVGSGGTAQCNGITITVTNSLSLKPTITSIGYSSGWSGASPITISGTNLTSGGNPSIKFRSMTGALKGTVLSTNMSYVSPRKLVFRANAVTSPYGSSTMNLPTGRYEVTVAAPGGTSNTVLLTITVSNPPAPTCTLSASPSVIHRGQSAKLLWGTDNASSLTINGQAVPVAVGHENVSPTNTTTYTGIASGSGGTAQCRAVTITVTNHLPSKPAITYIYPIHGSNSTTVTINGTNLEPGGRPSVEFSSIYGVLKGSVPFMKMSYMSSKKLVFNMSDMTKPHSPGTVSLALGTYKVTVATANGTSNAMYFSVLASISFAPTITSVSLTPVTAKVSPVQETMIIHGTRLTSGGNPKVEIRSTSGVLKGTMYYTNMNYISSQEIIFKPYEVTSALVPGTKYEVVVVTPNGTSNAMNFVWSVSTGLRSKTFPAGENTLTNKVLGHVNPLNLRAAVVSPQFVSGNVAHTQSSTNVATTKTSPNISDSFVANLWEGESNLEVVRLQRFLNQNSSTRIAVSGPGSLGEETEYYGHLTQSAVQNFQCENHIVCSGSPELTGYGVVGPKTRNKLNELSR